MDGRAGIVLRLQSPGRGQAFVVPDCSCHLLRLVLPASFHGLCWRRLLVYIVHIIRTKQKPQDNETNAISYKIDRCIVENSTWTINHCKYVNRKRKQVRIRALAAQMSCAQPTESRVPGKWPVYLCCYLSFSSLYLPLTVLFLPRWIVMCCVA